MSRLFEPTMASNSPPHSNGLPHSLSSNIGKKKRGGRQLRQVVLSPELKFSIRQFAQEVGMPRLMEPTGFRDFRGWLERVSGPTAANAWSKLVEAMIEETGSDRYRILFIKEEVVREIVRAIVVPRPGESAKLVSTNCGRQCARPRSGNTLMTILERILIEKGIVSANDIEIFMRDRSAPHTYMYRGDYQQHNPVRASASSSPYSPGHRNMSLEAITSSPEPRVSEPLRYSFPDVHRQGLDSHFRPDPEASFRPGLGATLRPLDTIHIRGPDQGASLRGPEGSLRGPEGSSPSSRLQIVNPPSSRLQFGGSGGSGSSRVNPIQQSTGNRQDRLPSFQELEESLDKRNP